MFQAARGIVNREGTAGDLSNGLIVVGNPEKACIEVRSANTAASGLRYDNIACVQGAELYFSGKAEDLEDNIIGTVTDEQVAALVTNAVTQPTEDGLPGIGADESAFAWIDTFLQTESGVETLPAAINDTLTLNASVVYEINGLVEVNDGGVLNIPAGTRLYGATGSSYLAVNQGGQIFADGTAEAPILFTSQADFTAGFQQDVTGRAAQGQWGGLSIFRESTHG